MSAPPRTEQEQRDWHASWMTRCPAPEPARGASEIPWLAGAAFLVLVAILAVWFFVPFILLAIERASR